MWRQQQPLPSSSSCALPDGGAGVQRRDAERSSRVHSTGSDGGETGAHVEQARDDELAALPSLARRLLRGATTDAAFHLYALQGESIQELKKTIEEASARLRVLQTVSGNPQTAAAHALSRRAAQKLSLLRMQHEQQWRRWSGGCLGQSDTADEHALPSPAHQPASPYRDSELGGRPSFVEDFLDFGHGALANAADERDQPRGSGQEAHPQLELRVGSKRKRGIVVNR
eukprot:COSAG04_NODE_5616_length_1550_cov_1.461751_2_plen_228_part_00